MTSAASTDESVIEEIEQESHEPGLVARFGAEAFGTFLLVLAILAVASYGALGGSQGALAVGLAGGLALMGGIAAVGHVSGGHFNPAVTLGMAVAGRMRWQHTPLYWLAQVIGGTAAAGMIRLIVPGGLGALLGAADDTGYFSTLSNGFDEHSPLNTVSQGSVTFSLENVFLVEAIVTALFVGVVLGASRFAPKIAPAAIGLTLGVGIMITAPISNASLNPARSLATAFFSDSWALQQVWVFVAAPLVGGLLAGLVASLARPVTVHDAAEYEYEDEDDLEEDLEESDEEVEVSASEAAAVPTFDDYDAEDSDNEGPAAEESEESDGAEEDDGEDGPDDASKIPEWRR